MDLTVEKTERWVRYSFSFHLRNEYFMYRHIIFRDQNSNYGGEITLKKEEKWENQFSSQEILMESLKKETG